MKYRSLPEIVSIGNAVEVRGQRGQWNVYMPVQLKGRDAAWAPIRLNGESESFDEFSRRDDARNMRDQITHVLSQYDDRPIYAEVRGDFAKSLVAKYPQVFPFSNKCVAILPFLSRDFEAVWKPSKLFLLNRVPGHRVAA